MISARSTAPTRAGCRHQESKPERGGVVDGRDDGHGVEERGHVVVNRRLERRRRARRALFHPRASPRGRERSTRHARFCNRVIALTARAEYVVQPPRTPTTRKGRSSGWRGVHFSTNGTKMPMASDPLRLMSNVTVGKWPGPSTNVVSRKNRANVPSAPPNAMRGLRREISRAAVPLGSVSGSSLLCHGPPAPGAHRDICSRCSLVRSHQPWRRFWSVCSPAGPITGLFGQY